LPLASVSDNLVTPNFSFKNIILTDLENIEELKKLHALSSVFLSEIKKKG